MLPVFDINRAASRQGCLGALERSRQESIDLRADLDAIRRALPEECRFSIYYFDHWLDNAVAARNGRVGPRWMKNLVSLCQRSSLHVDCDTEVIVVSKSNWRTSLARDEPHYAFFSDVVETTTGGLHVEFPWADPRRNRRQREYLASFGWRSVPFHSFIDVRQIRRAIATARSISCAHSQLASRVRTRNASIPGLFSAFCADHLVYCLLLEFSLQRYSQSWKRLYLTGETSTWGRAALRQRGLFGYAEARQHGIVLPTQLDYLHGDGELSGIPYPDTLRTYERYFSGIFDWVRRAGGQVIEWADPRMTLPPNYAPPRQAPEYVLFAHQPVDSGLTRRAVRVAREVARELELPLAIRPHPSARSGESRWLIKSADVLLDRDALLPQLRRAARLVTLFSTLAYEAAMAGVGIVLARTGDAPVREAFPPDLHIEERAA